MPRDYTAQPPNRVRRRDRAVEDDAWIEEFLRTTPTGSLATVHDGQPFINTNLFVYNSAANAIYMHTARVGRTKANVLADERVCFSASRIGRLLPAATAFGFSVEYAGVVVFGRAHVVHDRAEAARAMQMLLDKYAPHLRPSIDYTPPSAEELARTSVYKIDIDRWSGKMKKADADFPGAFYFEPASGKE
jgi:nitroimidazol reductase NimA-like FMN-containing flavoprotein (pyridoxamine 5'-phosphate oxidase superfamily)